jgi:hypothetical protein
VGDSNLSRHGVRWCLGDLGFEGRPFAKGGPRAAGSRRGSAFKRPHHAAGPPPVKVPAHPASDSPATAADTTPAHRQQPRSPQWAREGSQDPQGGNGHRLARLLTWTDAASVPGTAASVLGALEPSRPDLPLGHFFTSPPSCQSCQPTGPRPSTIVAGQSRSPSARSTELSASGCGGSVMASGRVRSRR